MGPSDVACDDAGSSVRAAPSTVTAASRRRVRASCEAVFTGADEKGLAYWFENAASNEAVGRGQMSDRTNSSAWGPPCRRSMPASSHSTEIGPV
jgi:hypothetical protein